MLLVKTTDQQYLLYLHSDIVWVRSAAVTDVREYTGYTVIYMRQTLLDSETKAEYRKTPGRHNNFNIEAQLNRGRVP